ncbi:MAG: PD40 domain-containing protein, partial [Candidatus Eremiobacteraeota bacterium]|nr:PD40 domain-containing protein [Candidatus Eremiobacteraeota bacterium]
PTISQLQALPKPVPGAMPPGIDATVNIDDYLTLDVQAQDPDGDALFVTWTCDKTGGFSAPPDWEPMEWTPPQGPNPGYWHSVWEWTPPDGAADGEVFVLTCQVKDARGSLVTAQVGAQGKVMALADGKLAVWDNGKVILMNTDGTNPQDLTPTQAFEVWEGIFSPDGSKIITPGDINGKVVLFEISRDGSGSRVMLDTTTHPGGPCNDLGRITFTPDGTRMIYAIYKGGIYDLWMAHTDGTNPVLLEGGFLYKKNGSLGLSAFYKGTGAYDHTNLSDMAVLFAEEQTGQLYEVPLTGGKIPIGTARYEYAAWNFATDKWAYTDPVSGGLVRGTYTPGSGFSKEVTLSGGAGWNPSWAPDGSKLVFGNGPNQVWTVAADGTNAKRIYTGNSLWSLEWGRQ